MGAVYQVISKAAPEAGQVRQRFARKALAAVAGIAPVSANTF